MAASLRDSVVVITGASGGIGRASAREFARRGATVVLAARRPEALEATLDECEQLGGRGLAIPTDVTDAEQVQHLASRAVEAYDKCDVWVNNAAVTLFGRLEETPHEAWERVVQTNLFGYANGARAAIRQFREQGYGTLVNVASMVAHIGQPYTSAYVSSKFAIRGLSECLRMELMDAPDIQVATVLPASIDTPLFQQAANYSGRAAKAMTPVYPPERVAKTIVNVAQHPKREMTVGNAARAIQALRTVAPGIAERAMARQVEQDHFQEGVPAASGPGNLFEPDPDPRGSVSGGWQWREQSAAETPTPYLMVAAGVAAVLAPVALLAAVRRRA